MQIGLLLLALLIQLSGSSLELLALPLHLFLGTADLILMLPLRISAQLPIVAREYRSQR